MMRHASVYQLGGYAVLFGAVCFALGIVIHAPQPTDLAAYSAVSMGPWMASHWLIAIGAALLAGGFTAFARHMSSTAGEGWSVLGFGATLATSALLIAVAAPEIAAFPMLRSMNADGANAGAQHAFLAINSWLMSLVQVVGPLFWLGVAFFALAMLKDPAWPRWLGQAGLVIAVVLIASNWAVSSFTVSKALFVVGNAWLALAGITFSRLAGASGRPGVAAPAGAYKAGDKVPTR